MQATPQSDNRTETDQPQPDNRTKEGEPKSDNPTLHQQAYKPILDTTNIPNTENPVMARVKVTKPNKENPIMDQEPKSENPPSENPTVGKPNCINNTDALNNTNLYKGSNKNNSNSKDQQHDYAVIPKSSPRYDVKTLINEEIFGSN